MGYHMTASVLVKQDWWIKSVPNQTQNKAQQSTNWIRISRIFYLLLDKYIRLNVIQYTQIKLLRSNRVYTSIYKSKGALSTELRLPCTNPSMYSQYFSYVRYSIKLKYLYNYTVIKLPLM